MSRNSYLFAYDISDKTRLRRIYRKAMGFGDPIQLSIFFCDLTKSEFLIFQDEIRKIVNSVEDSVIFINMGPSQHNNSKKIISIGRSPDFGSSSALII
jgi:CRISPR-associated protein Cas2